MEQKVIGVLGGGQLGRMMAQAASKLSIPLITLDSKNSPASQVINPTASHPNLSPILDHQIGSFNNSNDILTFSQSVDILTIEIEHVNVSILKTLQNDPRGGRSKTGLKIYPSPEVIEIIQDKFKQKQFLIQHQIPVSNFEKIEESEDLEIVEKSILNISEKFGYPLMLKSRLFAYDGKGNYLLNSPEEIPTAIQSLTPQSSKENPNPIIKLYAERFAPFDCEIAVMVIKAPSTSSSEDPQIRSYPPVQTVHRDNICHTVYSPLRKGTKESSKRSIEVAEKAIAALGPGAVGVFAVEMFLMPNGEILVNEIAPRPHNSYHHTLSSTTIDQFTAHLLSITSRPLPDPRSFELKVTSTAMVNILGHSNGQIGLKEIQESIEKIQQISNVSIELYGKSGCRNGRKMGHINIVGKSDSEVKSKVEQIIDLLPSNQTKDITKKEEVSIIPHSDPNPLVSIIMGSDSDLPTMIEASRILSNPIFSIPHELTIVSAHRTPQRMIDFAKSASHRGVKVIIAGAGGAAHLPGMVAALTPLPVIGVPVKCKTLDGVDSLYSIVQMPRGIPVATVAIGNSTNAALLAIRILSVGIPSLLNQMESYMNSMETEVLGKVEKMKEVGWEDY
ncbi:AIR carboxylase-domain-containing protein [Melampsora americana]|nr:AIR carboxylase-domain-containing protein [Melampsora americana]